MTSDELLSSFQQTADGGYILGGHSYLDSSGDKTQNTWEGSDYWIVKIDSLGNKQRDKDFGGTREDSKPGDIFQTSDKGFLFAGASFSNISGNKTENNLGLEQSWIIKTDSLGNMQWDKTVKTGGIDPIRFAIETNDGCFVMANFTGSGIAGYKTQLNWGDFDFWIVKFCDSTLTTNLAPAFSAIETGIQISPNPSNGIIQITFSSNQKTNLNAEVMNTLWQKVYQSALPSSKLRSNLDLSFLPKGIYFLKISGGNYATCKKFVVD